MAGPFSHCGLLPAPNAHLHRVNQTLQPPAPRSASPGQNELKLSSQDRFSAKRRAGQSNSAKQLLPIYQDELGAMNLSVSSMRFVVRNRGNKGTTQRSFTY